MSGAAEGLGLIFIGLFLCRMGDEGVSVSESLVPLPSSLPMMHTSLLQASNLS